MAKCDFCGKDVAFGIRVSHSHRRTNRTWKPKEVRISMVLPICWRTILSGVQKKRDMKSSRFLLPIAESVHVQDVLPVATKDRAYRRMTWKKYGWEFLMQICWDLPHFITMGCPHS